MMYLVKVLLAMGFVGALVIGIAALFADDKPGDEK